MKKTIVKLLCCLSLVMGFAAISAPAEAWWRYYHTGYYHPYYYGYGYRHCSYVPGHYGRYGRWHPAHRVCWY